MFSFVLALTLASAPAMAQASPASQPISIAVDTARPLSAAIDALSESFEWVITYEDPKASQLHGGPLAFTYEPPARGGLDPAAVIQALLDAHDEQDHPDKFRLIRTGDIYHVVPAASRPAAGGQRDARSLLDARISIPAGSRNLTQAIEQIASALSDATGEQVTAGMVPTNLAVQTTVTGGARNEPARDVLLRVLGAADRKLSWHIFYGAKLARYVLNVHIVDIRY